MTVEDIPTGHQTDCYSNEYLRDEFWVWLQLWDAISFQGLHFVYSGNEDRFKQEILKAGPESITDHGLIFFDSKNIFLLSSCLWIFIRAEC